MSLTFKIEMLLGLVVAPALALVAGYEGFSERLMGALSGWYGGMLMFFLVELWITKDKAKLENPS